jgi:uncharacterized protein
MTSILISCGWKKRDLTGYDIDIFKGPAWRLAKAVDNEDTIKIKRILCEGKISVDYQEPYFGHTVLLWAVRMGKISSVEVLLKNGANPNLQNTYDGTSAFMEACKFGINYDRDTQILRLLLAYGGDPNSEQKGPRPKGSTKRDTPLLLAASCCFEKVKLLVEAGADIDYRTEFGGNALYSALNGANEKLEILNYLVIEKKADICLPVRINSDGKRLYVNDKLKLFREPDSIEHYNLLNKLIAYVDENTLNCDENK